MVETVPDKNNDWINQRDENYDNYLSMDGEVFLDKAYGVSTNRDAWVYGFSESNVQRNSQRLIDNYNSELVRLKSVSDEKERLKQLNTSDNFIKWSTGLKQKFVKNKNLEFDSNAVIVGQYRPFTKKYLQYQTDIIERPSRFKDVFGENNQLIYTTSAGASRGFSCFISKKYSNLHFLDSGKDFTVTITHRVTDYFDNNSNISESLAQQLELSEDDVSYYVYGVLNLSEYQENMPMIYKKLYHVSHY